MSTLAVAGSTTFVLHCGSSVAPFDPPGSDSGEASDGGDATIDVEDDHVLRDSGTAPDDGTVEPPPPTPVVYAHSPTVLYRIDPETKAVTTVGPFKGGCTSVIDMALDKDSNAYVTTFGALYKLDLETATCTLIATGSYPNSLSFVPQGTVDPDAEALVGYFGSTYARIDTTTGAITNIGSLAPGYSSSGDIVSVINGGTFLTVVGSGADNLIQVDPVTGDILQNYGSVGHSAVYGLAFWAGTLYGFDDSGKVFSIEWIDDHLETTDIEIPDAPPGLQFWGAGSTTIAPPTAPDGGGIPIIK